MDERLDNISEEEFEAYKALVSRLTEDWVETEKNLMKTYLNLEEQSYCGGHPADESYYDKAIEEEEDEEDD